MITITQIKDLRREAGEAGDIPMRILCDMALYGEDSFRDEDCLDEEGYPDYSGGGYTGRELKLIHEFLRMNKDEAWEAIVDYID